MSLKSSSPAPRRTLADTTDVAEYLDVPKATLDKWAHLGTGPRYSRVGRHRRYRWADVEKWLDANAQGGAAA
ncbi:helix-turn-helix transcriptional regulator [Nocardiopsis coralli]|uniref:helix-turn-helix transcriptional regulator n=1 Tax=Nocardiopsis coralli TaxID=2772213 RepID=UPI001F3AC594|nr:helix-turn-helix domain-containing protein [Nocardiopsis coralli]